MDELKPCSRRAMWNAVTELEDMALHQSVKKRLSAETLAIAIAAISEKAGQNRRPAPENKPLTCEGCVNNGCWENEVEYGYPSPCTGCKRRASDNYARKPGQEEK